MNYVNPQVQKEYRKFIRRHSWLSQCLGCSKGASSGATGALATATGVNASKELVSQNTSSNPSGPTTESSELTPHVSIDVASSPTLHQIGHSVCNIANTHRANLPINVNLSSPSMRAKAHFHGAHQKYSMTPSNHNRNLFNQQGIRIPLLHPNTWINIVVCTPTSSIDYTNVPNNFIIRFMCFRYAR